MSVNNIKAQLQNYRTADEITAARKSGKIDASVEAELRKFFGKIDSNGDGKISDDEWSKADKIINENQNNRSDAASETHATHESNNSSTEEFPKDEQGNIITYPKHGETFQKTAERLGFKEGTPEYEEFAKANKDAQKRKWFNVGDEVKIPPSIQDKVDKNGIISKKEGDAEVDKYWKWENERSRDAGSSEESGGEPTLTEKGRPKGSGSVSGGGKSSVTGEIPRSGRPSRSGEVGKTDNTPSPDKTRTTPGKNKNSAPKVHPREKANEAQRKQAKILAQKLHKQIQGASMNSNTIAMLKEINDENVVYVMDEYKKLTGGKETLAQAVEAEWGLDSNTVKQYICKPLVGYAKKHGVTGVYYGDYMKKNDMEQINKWIHNAETRINQKVEIKPMANAQQVKKKEAAAPTHVKQIAEDFKKRYGGNAKVTYNPKTEYYEVTLTDVNNKDIKQMKWVVSEKPWQDSNSFDGSVSRAYEKGKATVNKGTYNNGIAVLAGAYKGIKAGIKSAYNDYTAVKNIQAKDYIVSEQITYADGKVTDGNYGRGSVKQNKLTKSSSTKTKEEAKLNTAADISIENTIGMHKNGRDFSNSLTKNKADLMRTLNIDNDTYNMLAQTAIGIAGKETRYGAWVTKDENGDTDINYSLIGKDSLDYIGARSVVKEMAANGSANSVGLTQLKFGLHSKDPKIKQQLAHFGITKEEDLKDPDKSAIATVIVLNSMNNQLDSQHYKNAMAAAEGRTVYVKGWEMGEDGIAKKTNDGSTKPWKNHVSRQDALCALWNGGPMAESLSNGRFEPQTWAYCREVRGFSNKYNVKETKESRAAAVQKEEETRAFKNMDNTGEMGGISFMPAMYTDKQKHMNTPVEIKSLRDTLTAKGLDSSLTRQLCNAMQNGEIGFDFGLTKEEINSLTNADIKLILKHLNQLKLKINVNTGDGITANEASTLRNTYASTVGNTDNAFRTEYLNNHSKVYNDNGSNSVLREQSTDHGSSNYVDKYGQRRGFRHEQNRGVNTQTTKGTISPQQNVLAQSAYNVAMDNPNNLKSGNCLDGVKRAMRNAGIDVSGMSKYGNTPKYVKNWFDANPKMFTQVKTVANADGSTRALNYSDLKTLPAGYIVLWIPDSNSEYADQAGHSVITNGYGQGSGDATDNLEWGAYTTSNNTSGKGEHGHFVVYKLSDNWEVDASGKLVFKG